MDRRLEFWIDKQKLVGDLHLPTETLAPFPCVITSHGYKSNRNSEKWLQIGHRLPLEGIAVLRFDHRGALNGESAGDFENTTLSARVEDLLAAINTVNRIPEIDCTRLGLMGSSLGGMDVLIVKNEMIKAKVVMSTPFRIPPPSEAMRLAFGKQEYWDYPDGTRIRKEFYEGLERYNLAADIGQDNCPLLVIQGDLDEVVPKHHARMLYESGGTRVKALRMIDGADHSFSDLEKLNQALSYAFDWFKSYLRDDRTSQASD